MALMQIDHGSNHYLKMVQLRDMVLRKPLGLSFTDEELAHEKNDTHIVCIEDDKMLGCCVLVKQNADEVRLRQMAVAPNLHGKGIGASLLSFAENIAVDKGYKKMTMHARDTAIGFYEKLGYTVIGTAFEEVTIMHHVMEKELYSSLKVVLL